MAVNRPWRAPRPPQDRLARWGRTLGSQWRRSRCPSTARRGSRPSLPRGGRALHLLTRLEGAGEKPARLSARRKSHARDHLRRTCEAGLCSGGATCQAGAQRDEARVGEERVTRRAASLAVERGEGGAAGMASVGGAWMGGGACGRGCEAQVPPFPLPGQQDPTFRPRMPPRECWAWHLGKDVLWADVSLPAVAALQQQAADGDVQQLVRVRRGVKVDHDGEGRLSVERGQLPLGVVVPQIVARIGHAAATLVPLSRQLGVQPLVLPGQQRQPEFGVGPDRQLEPAELARLKRVRDDDVRETEAHLARVRDWRGTEQRVATHAEQPAPAVAAQHAHADREVVAQADGAQQRRLGVVEAAAGAGGLPFAEEDRAGLSRREGPAGVHAVEDAHKVVEAEPKHASLVVGHGGAGIFRAVLVHLHEWRRRAALRLEPLGPARPPPAAPARLRPWVAQAQQS
eukprot:scaffold7024_cov110-Isochrysis_galbana.AAC.3